MSRGNLWDTVGYRGTQETLPPAVLYVNFSMMPESFYSTWSLLHPSCFLCTVMDSMAGIHTHGLSQI